MNQFRQYDDVRGFVVAAVMYPMVGEVVHLEYFPLFSDVVVVIAAEGRSYSSLARSPFPIRLRSLSMMLNGLEEVFSVQLGFTFEAFSLDELDVDVRSTCGTDPYPDSSSVGVLLLLVDIVGFFFNIPLLGCVPTSGGFFG
ncbi:hypothetical protein TPS_05829 [Trichinella pseudospiralis]